MSEQTVGERTLILLRHAKSDWSVETADQDRPLARRGRRQAPEAGRWLAAHAGPIQLAVVSPATRAQTTWDLVAAELSDPPRLLVDDRVYAASGEELLRIVRGLPHDAGTVVLVGHNPGLQDLAADLSGSRAAMPTSAIAVFTVSGAWSTAAPERVTLRALGRPPA